MGVDTSKDFRNEDAIPDDPKFISQPPRTTGLNIVILKLPRCLRMKPILKELLSNELIEESQLPIRYESVEVLRFDNEKNARKVVFYLNSNYGDIADLGYAPITHSYPSDFEEAHKHLATIKDATASEPNDIFQAYEKKQVDENGFPVYEAVDVESKVKHRRNRLQEKAKTNRQKHLEKRHASANQSRLKKNAFGQEYVSFGGGKENEVDYQEKMERNMIGGKVNDGKVDERKAIELEFTKRSRDLRRYAYKAGGEILKEQFLRDFRVDLIACKKRKWQRYRTRSMYAMQGERMLERTKMKQKFDRNLQHKNEAASKNVWSSRSW